MDGSFHSPEWHAARLAGLKTSHTVTWEEFKKKQKVIRWTLLLYLCTEPSSFCQREYYFINSNILSFFFETSFQKTYVMLISN